MKSIASLLPVVLLFLSVGVSGQNIVNLDLNNIEGEAGNDAPDSWTISNGTPDMVDGTPATKFRCELSTVDVCGTYATGTSNTLFARLRNSNNDAACNDLPGEGIEQTISGLVVGAPYQVCFQAVNVGQGDNCTAIPPQTVQLQVTVSGQSTLPVAIPYDGSPSWNEYCVNYTATATSQTFGVQMPDAAAGLGKAHVFFDVVQNIEATDTDDDGNPDVNDPNDNAATAVDDAANATALETAVIDIIANDDFLDNGDPANLGTIAITNLGTGSATGTISFDNNTGELNYTPPLAEGGTTRTVDYQVCNTDPAPDVCDTATVTLTIAAATDTDNDGNPDVTDANDNTPTAVDDVDSGIAGVAGTFNILSNDDFLPNNDANNVGSTAITDLGTGTATGTVSFNTTTGELTYTPTIVEGGTAPTVNYQVCNTTPEPDVCATATATITVAAATDTDGDGNPDVTDANDNTPTAVDDVDSGIAGVAGTFNILSNDDFLPNNDANNVGSTAITDLGTGTATGTVSFNTTTGELTYTPTIVEGGTAPTVNYQVCNTTPEPDVCATATATITVAAATDTDGDGNPDVNDANDNTPTAVDDADSGTAGIAGTFNILSNDDFLPNNDANNVGSTAITDLGTGTATGTVSFNTTTGDITYTPTIAEGGTSPTVHYQVCNTAPAPDVCATATATITVAVATDTDGDGNPDVSDPNDATPIAVNDNVNGTAGIADTFTILANDDFLPNNDANNVGNTAIADLGTGTATGTVSFNNATGELTYTPEIAEGGTTPTVIYRVCNIAPEPDVCDSATVAITVAAATDTDGDGNPDATDVNDATPAVANDADTGTAGIEGRIDLLGNDDFLPNSDANNVGNTQITRTGGTASGAVSFDNASGELVYTPTIAEGGTAQTVVYQVCNIAPDPDVCASATATITIAAATDTDGDGNPDVNEANDATPVAADDAGAGIAGVAGSFNILANDDFLPNSDANNVGATEITDLGTGTATGAVSFNNTTGEITYTPTVAEGGTAPTVIYQVCNVAPEPDVCASATATITVATATDTDGDGNPDVNDPNVNAPTAADDSENGIGGVPASYDILANDDFLANNDANNVGTTTITRTGGTAVGSFSFNSGTGELTYTPDFAEAGSSPTVIYQVCNTAPASDVCQTATVTIAVVAPTDTDNDGNPDVNDPNVNAAVAADDSGNGIAGVPGSYDLLANDDFLPNNDGANVGTTQITDLGTGTANGAVSFNNATGEMTYTPTIAEGGTMPTVIYQVCNTDPATDVCASVTATITVAAATDTDGDGNPDVNDPNDNMPSAAGDSGAASPGAPAVFDILANDDFLPNNDVNNVGTTTLSDTTNGSAGGTIALDAATGELTYTPPGAEAGTAVTVEYEVCNTDPTPDICAAALVTINVATGPDTDNDGNPDATDPVDNAPTTANDVASTTADAAVTLNLLANDDFLPNNATNNVGTTSISRTGGTATGTTSFDSATGEVTYTPTLAEAGTMPTVIYEVCNTDPTPDVCASATATITVTAAPDTDGDGNPDANDANDSTPTAIDDAGNGTAGIAGSYDLLANDDFLPNNDPINAGTIEITDLGTGTAAGAVSFNNATGELTYTPTIAEGGTMPTIVYQVCNTDPATDVCASAIATITVAAATDTDGDGNPDVTDPNVNVPTAANDADSTTAGVAVTLGVLGNDDFLANNNAGGVGVIALTDTATGTANGSISFDNDTGELTYTPTFAEGGTAPTVIYQVCNTAPATAVCATATAIITVAAAPDTDNDGNPDVTDANATTPTAAADSGNATPAVAAVFNVLGNDDFLANNDAGNAGTTSLANTGNGSAAGAVALDPATGEITYTPTNAEAGQTVTVEYEVCNTEPTPAVCATALLSVDVATGPDTDNDGNPDATDPNVNTPQVADDDVGGTSSVAASYDVLANDDFLPNNALNNAGTTTLVDLGTGTAQGVVSVDASTGEITYTPTAGEAGSMPTVIYEVCNTDPAIAVCASATLTITVSAGPDADGDGNPDATDPNINAPNAADDSGNGSVGVTDVYDLLANDDFLPNSAANNAGVTTITDLGTGSAAGTIGLDANSGELSYTPTQAEANSVVTVDYQVCNTGPDPDVCANATATITIAAAMGPDTDDDGTPDVIDANPAAPTAADDAFAGSVNILATHDVLANDDFLPNNNGNGLGTAAITDQATGTAMGSVAFDADIGTLDYTPTFAESGDAVTIDYQVCNAATTPATCDTATVTINVAALPDTDMDGIPDAVEGTGDSDGDGLPDFNDPDADNDGIPDAVEAGPVAETPVDSDGDGAPDYLDIDSDGDRIIDRIEVGAAPTVPVDSDGDGLADYIDTDADNDNIPDALEDFTSPVPSGNDVDLDGIDDAVDVSETGGNDDGLSGGVAGNGIDDALEPLDTDGDGIPNHLDLDSDGDGLLDILESLVVPAPLGNDEDGDGIDDALDVNETGGVDLNNNGVDDALEPVDTDSDGKPDYLDIDADNDSIPDAVEAAPNGSTLPTLSGNDGDSDGIDDAVDVSVTLGDDDGVSGGIAGNGIDDAFEPVNTDNALNPAFGDNVPDYLDLDSDNDSLLDIEEAGNGVGVPEVSDVNMDGLVDSPAEEGSVPVPADTDSEAEPIPGNRDLIPDYRDLESTNSANDGSGLYDISTNPNPPADNGAGMVNDATDSDGDGIADSTDPRPNGFGGGIDSDLDGLPNDMDLDDDNDGIPDLVEGFNASDPAASTDTDGDGTPDYLDLDSDNDGLTDLIESSVTAVDADNNGRIDTFVDVNIDGLDDIVAVQTPLDTDADGTPDYRDLDSDNDGLTDLAESLPPGIAADSIDADGNGVQDAINPVTGRPLDPLTPQDNDMDGAFDFRVAAGITLNNLPGGPGVGLRTSVSGGGGSMGVFGIGLMSLAALRKRLPKKATSLAASGLLVLLVAVAPASQLNAGNLVQEQVQERERTLCGFYSNSGNQRLTSKVGRDGRGADFGNCWYGGLGVAYSHIHPEGSDGNGWNTDNSEDRDIGWEAIIGKRLSEKWFAELKYVDQGEAGLETPITALDSAYPDANITYRTTSLMLGRYFRNADQRFNLYAKAGMASINNDDHDNGDPATVQFNEVTSEQFAFGAGAEYRFKGRARWFVRLNADFYDQDSSMASLSLNRYLGGKTTRRAVGPVVVTAVAASPAPASLPALVPEPYPKVQPAPGPSAAQRAADCGKFDSVVEGVNFETDSARLTSDSRFRLLSYARTLASYPETVILVSAHTDWIGSGEYNQSLSDRRAASVVEYLIQSGVNPGQLLSRGFGESRPIASNNSAEGRSRNRRVELTIVESPGCGR